MSLVPFARAPYPGYSPLVLWTPGPFWHPDIGALFLGAAVPATPRGHTEVPRKVSTHSESGGRTLPALPTKAKAHQFRSLFPLGPFGTSTIGRLLLGGAQPMTPRGHPEVPRKASSHSESGGKTSPAAPT